MRFPKWVIPMSATLTQERFTGDGWTFERKLDGIRLVAFKRGRDVRLFSRTRNPQNLPGIAGAISALPADLTPKVDHVEVETVDQISLVLRDGRVVVWGSADRTPRKAQIYAALRSVPGCEAAAEIGEVKTEPPGMVLVETSFGGKRVMDQLAGDPLPRIC